MSRVTSVVAASETRVPVSVLICLLAAMIAGGYLIFRTQARIETERIQQNLAAVAELKADQITQWIERNKSNSTITSRASPVADRTLTWFVRGMGPGEDFEWLRSRLEALRQIYLGSEMVIADVAGKALVTTETQLPDLADLEPLMQRAIAEGRPLVGDFRWTRLTRGSPYISVPIAAPLIPTGEEGKPIGVLLIMVDADQFLYPLIQKWPVPSETAETMLVKRDGDDVLFLNELRHQDDTALALRAPLDHPSRLVSQAARGETGFLEGTDYRQEPVIGYALHIPDTGWLMVAKIDKSEVYAPLRRMALTRSIFAFALLTVSSLSLFLWWRNRKSEWEKRNAESQARELQAEFKQQFLSQQYASLSKYANDIILLTNLNRQIVDINDRAEEAYGLSRSELIGKNMLELLAPESQVPLEDRDMQIRESGSGIFENVHRRRDGTEFPVEVSARLIERGSDTYVQHIVRDITERKMAEEGLKLAAAVYRESSEAMMVLDENRHIIMVNQAFADMTGYEFADVVGQHPRLLRVGNPEDAFYKDDDAFYQDMWQQADKTGRFRGEVWHKKKNGQSIAVQLTVNTIAGETGVSHRYVVLLSDITEKKRSDELIWNQANFDALTGLPNRRFFRERLDHEVRNARRSNLPLALMFIDLDGFKDVNDTLGHDMGDLLLKEAAERLKSCVRESDTVARLGGDEFTIILTELHDSRNVDRVARQILRALVEPVRLGEELAYVSASIGITLFPNDAEQVEDLIKNADQAMYAAKESGRNQYHYFTQAMQDAAIARMRLINDLRGALEGDQFEIVYQPIVEMSTGHIRKAEALIRWHHPGQGLINPIDFISAAEDTGMITDFGNWIFREAAKQVAAWREKYHPEFQISVNISPVQFRKQGIDPTVWFQHLKSLGLPGQGIVVEITEGLLLEANPKVAEQLLMLREVGIEVALDDFGTGYSSLSYLQKFNIDYVKIDQAFVRNLTSGSNELALCEAMIVMAHRLDIKVIAEGIEAARQNELLANSGCDYAQGYFFSRPVPTEEFECLLEADPFSFQESLKI